MEDEPPAENQQNQKDPENRTGNKMGETDCVYRFSIVQTCRMVMVL